MPDAPPARRLPAGLDAARVVLQEPGLLRLQAAWLSIHAGKTALLVINLVLAYQVGGPAAMGLFGIARFLPPTVLSVLAGLPTARWAPDRVLVGVNALRTLSVVLLLAVVRFDAPIEAFYLVVALESGVGAFSRPLHVAILPFVARTPAGLVAANVASSAVEGLGTFIGPAIAGMLLVFGASDSALLAVVAIYAAGVAAIAVLPVRTQRLGDASSATFAGVRRQAVAGIRTCLFVRGPRLVLTGILLQTLVRGLLNILIVLIAVELLDLGDGGVGSLNAVLGAGGLLGAAVALLLAGQPRMAPAFALSLAAWGAPLLVIGLLPQTVVAFAAMLAIGVANSVVDVTAYTLLQRTTTNDERVAVMGVLDSLANLGQAAGGLLAPILVVATDLPTACIVAGAILPVAAAGLWFGLRNADPGVQGDDAVPALLRGVHLFAPLSLAAIEDVNRRLQPVAYEPGGWLMQQGEPGVEFVIIEAGDVEIIEDGTHIRTLGPGTAVGEIALLKDVPRTASVRAVGAVRGYSLGREDFLDALTAGPAVGS